MWVWALLRAPSTRGACRSCRPSPPPLTRTACRYMNHTSVTRRIAATAVLFAVGVAGVAISPMLPLQPLHGFIVRAKRSHAPPQHAPPSHPALSPRPPHSHPAHHCRSAWPPSSSWALLHLWYRSPVSNNLSFSHMLHCPPPPSPLLPLTRGRCVAGGKRSSRLHAPVPL